VRVQDKPGSQSRVPFGGCAALDWRVDLRWRGLGGWGEQVASQPGGRPPDPRTTAPTRSGGYRHPPPPQQHDQADNDGLDQDRMEDADNAVAVVVGVGGPLLWHEAPSLARLPTGRSTGCAGWIPCLLSFKQTDHTIATTASCQADTRQPW
jgi:hypothetical protein